MNETDNGMGNMGAVHIMYMQMYFYMGTKVIFLFESYVLNV